MSKTFWRRSKGGAATALAVLAALFAFFLFWVKTSPAEPIAPGIGITLPLFTSGEEAETAKIAETVAELRRTLSALKERRLAFYQEEAGRKERLSLARLRLEEETQHFSRLSHRVSELKLETAALSKEKTASEKDVLDRERTLKACADIIENRAQGLRDAIRAGIPFEQVERVRFLAGWTIRKGSADPVRWAAELDRAFEYERSLGSTAQAFEGRIRLEEGERPRTRFMRVGLVYMAFVTEGGETAGVLKVVRDSLSGRSSYAWKTGFDYFTRWRVRNAVEICEKRRPPAVLELPVDLGSVVKR